MVTTIGRRAPSASQGTATDAVQAARIGQDDTAGFTTSIHSDE